MKSHALAMLLVHNARFAALLAKRLIALCDEVAVADDGRDDLFTVSEALSTLDAQIPLTARDCLALGPMRNFDAATIAAACDVAMALRLRDLLNDKKLSHREVQLTDSLGLTTNRAFIKSERTFEQRREEERSESGLDEFGFVNIDIIPDPYLYCAHTLVAPPRGRYEMSTAQYLLCRMNYGLKELTDAPSWRRYEVIVAQYVADLIRGLNARPLRTLMLHINAPYRRISEDVNLTKRLCFKTVAIVQRDESISLDCLDAVINPELAHVVVGAPGSPYGEVVVILPHIAVIGIRCTFHGYDIAVNELSEKTLRDGLKTFAQVPGGEKYYCIWATNGVLGFPQGTFGEMRN